MAEKHEAAPSAMKPSSQEFRQTIKLGSASSWDKNILSLFHVDFDQSKHSPLEHVINAKYLQPPTPGEDCYQGRLLHARKVLIVGYLDIMQASEAARGEDFTNKRSYFVRNFRGNPLSQFYSELADFFDTHSAEAKDRIRSKARYRSISPKKKPKLSHPDDNVSPISDPEQSSRQSSTQHSSIDQPSSNFPPSTPVSNKRVFSGESFGPSSTETTPTKITHAESVTQSLQNTLVTAIIDTVWDGEVNVSWAQNREMYLKYRPYFNLSYYI